MVWWLLCKAPCCLYTCITHILSFSRRCTRTHAQKGDHIIRVILPLACSPSREPGLPAAPPHTALPPLLGRSSTRQCRCVTTLTCPPLIGSLGHVSVYVKINGVMNIVQIHLCARVYMVLQDRVLELDFLGKRYACFKFWQLMANYLLKNFITLHGTLFSIISPTWR